MSERFAAGFAWAAARAGLRQPDQIARLRSASLNAAQWALYFGASFAITAAVLRLAHI
jgi:hypothetical protein